MPAINALRIKDERARLELLEYGLWSRKGGVGSDKGQIEVLNVYHADTIDQSCPFYGIRIFLKRLQEAIVRGGANCLR